MSMRKPAVFVLVYFLIGGEAQEYRQRAGQ